MLDINLCGEMVLPVADLLAALRVPFIFTTGYDDKGHRGLHKAVQMLLKPFNGDVVPGAVRALLSA